MEKSPDAFRTISEVADHLETPAHVLRFWESRFPQIKPVKRAGGRRYYRPSDVALLTGIKHLLHDEGMTIRGVQKILREQGVRHVAGIGGELPHEYLAQDDLAHDDLLDGNDAIAPPETADIIALDGRFRRDPAPLADPPVAADEPAQSVTDPLPDENTSIVDAAMTGHPSEAEEENLFAWLGEHPPLEQGAAPVPAPGSDAPPPVPASDPVAVPEQRLAARVRLLHAQSLDADRLAGLSALRNRLATLRARMAEAARTGPR